MENEFIEEAPDIEDIAVLNEIKEGHFLILATNLDKDYEIGDFIVRAVDGVSIRIKESAFIIIKGPSGAGKTTLLNLIGGLDTPNRGKYSLVESRLVT